MTVILTINCHKSFSLSSVLESRENCH